MGAFTRKHQYLLSFDRRTAEKKYDFSGRHAVLLSELTKLLERLFKRFDRRIAGVLTAVIAENILNLNEKQYPFSQVEPAFEKLMQ